jgi:hypothetical protein
MSQFKSQKKTGQSDPITPLHGIERNTDRLQREELLRKLIETMEGNGQPIGNGPMRTKFVDRKDRSPTELLFAAARCHILQRSDKAPPSQMFICYELARGLIEDICSQSNDGFIGKFYFPDWNGGLAEISLGLDTMLQGESLDVHTVLCVHLGG